jgi:hypothetical protein
MSTTTGQKSLPCVGNAALYDIVLFDRRAPMDARVRAATLCGTCPAPCGQKVTADGSQTACAEPSYGSYLAHKKRGEEACDGCKEAKRVYDRERYAKNPRKARAPQRAYEARKRAARDLTAAGRVR